MAELWKELRVGDRIRLIEMPPEFLQKNYYLHPDTRRTYEKLLARGRSLRISEIKNGGPWVHVKFRHKKFGWLHHCLLFNHGGIVRVKHRK